MKVVKYFISRSMGPHYETLNPWHDTYKLKQGLHESEDQESLDELMSRRLSGL